MVRVVEFIEIVQKVIFMQSKTGLISNIYERYFEKLSFYFCLEEIVL